MTQSKFLNLDDQLVVYKIIRNLNWLIDNKKQKIKSSTTASGKARIYYELNKWAYPPKEFLDQGYGIFAFDSIKNAINYGNVLRASYYGDSLMASSGTYELYEARTSHLLSIPLTMSARLRIAEAYNKKEEINLIGYLSTYVPLVTDFIEGTVFCKDLILTKELIF